MKNLMKFRSLLFIFALSFGTLVSCKDKETTIVDETSETTVVDTTAVPVMPEEVPADTTAMPAETVPAQ